MGHPRERRLLQELDRREFLAAAISGFPVAAALLAACDRGASQDPVLSSAPAVPGSPTALPLFEGLAPIADDLAPERNARLRVYGWGPSYFSPQLLRVFEEKYGCIIDFIPFRTMEDAIQRLRTGAFEADVFVPTIKVIGTLAAARQLRPLNYSYIPHLASNVWHTLLSPFYDTGPRYSVPYFVWTTGTSWRHDLVAKDPREYDSPYDIFWDPVQRGHVHVLNSVQDLVGMGLLQIGVDANTEDPEEIAHARNALLDMVDAVQPQLDSSDYHDLFTGAAHVHQSWSGNLAFAKHYAPTPSDLAKLSYWWPPSGDSGKPGLKGNDVLVVMANARNPVLAHHFLDFFLEDENSYANSVYNGYQAPVHSVNGDHLVAAGAVSENLRSIIVTQEDFALGTQELELSPDADALFHSTYDDVEHAAKAATLAG